MTSTKRCKQFPQAARALTRAVTPAGPGRWPLGRATQRLQLDRHRLLASLAAGGGVGRRYFDHLHDALRWYAAQVGARCVMRGACAALVGNASVLRRAAAGAAAADAPAGAAGHGDGEA